MSFLFVHSLTEDKLFKSIQLGGFPLPSIAVITPENEFKTYGNITFIIKPDVLDPKDKKNLIYDRDIFSQRVPEMEYDINKKNLYKINDYLSEKSLNFEKFYNFYDIESMSRKKSSYIIERFEQSMLIKKEFFDIYNKEYKIPLKKSKFNTTLIESDIFKDYLLNNEVELNEQFKNIILDSFSEIELKYNSLIGIEITKSLIEDIKKSIFFIENGDYIFKNDSKNMIYNNTIKLILKDQEIIKGKDEEIDFSKYEKDINDFIYSNFENYKKYLQDNYFKEFLYNPHFKNGNKKLNFSLENIEKSMLKQKAIASEDIPDTSIGKISANFAKRFKSFEDIDFNLHLIKDKKERYDQKDKINSELSTLTNELSIYSNNNRHFEILEIISEGFKFVKTYDSFINYLRKNDFNTNEITIEHFEKFNSILDKIHNLDNHYFECKPQKTLYFEDFEAVLLPKETSKELVDFLNDKVKIYFYDKDELNSKTEIFKKHSINLEKNKNKPLTKLKK